ncbi:endonuclease/exonuclease/phosphatase family protein [Novosphingobium sp. Gsoil 351]|uniref:endonuclease/exonuclease/phosphatase family protein n=1 Tax=Novosphingobium sp. Gsoil 351 TaxID=2675225 RepID=UPI0012B4C35F|nr:endonuclease/exonuclease/phosphatase family protein [Novosphingobium sp. Gsoil 351]QGN55095.1 endonuclease [Novosphingobium sp. Gsoil 351]
MRITVASYNIHKAVGLDRRRDPERIMAILREVDADVIALQECDRRFGERFSVIPRTLLDDSPWCAVPLAGRPHSLGWHGNAILVRKGIGIDGCSPVPLPTLEPRGAVCADLAIAGKPLRIVGMHLDISGLRRHHQVRSVVGHVTRTPSPTVLMGDLNDWSRNGRALREFGEGWSTIGTGLSFPARRPVAPLDKIVVSHDLVVAACGVHRSALAAVGSDHLPVWATLTL